MTYQDALKDYIEVKDRIQLFKAKHPEGSLQFEFNGTMEINGQIIIWGRAYAYRDQNDLRPGVGTAWELVPGKTPFTRGSEIMVLETSAWGRAIAALGIGLSGKGIATRQEVETAQERDPWATPNSDIKAVKAADLSRYDRIILTLGEASHESGEGYSKADINLSPLDLALLEAVSERHADVVAVIFSGRPLILTPVAQQVKAILQANLPGTEAGNALYELLFGINSPSGKLAMTYPYHAGQVPIYYNHTPTGRPLKEEDPMYRYRTHYIDVPNDPLYPFGFGLNYGDIRIKDVVSSSLCDENTPIKVTMTLKNHGSHSATEVLQGYIEALTYSVSRPVNELKRFERVTLNPGETKSIEWVMTLDDFRSYNKNMQWTAEKRPYHVKLGFSSKTTHVCAVDVKDSVY